MTARDALPAGTAASVAAARAQAAAAWAARTPRERRALALAAVALAGLLVWTVGMRPALKTVREAPAAIDRLDAELQQMQRLAAESRTLRATPPIPPAQAAAALQAATQRLGSAAKLSVQGDRATLTITGGMAGSALQGWLSEARAAARARPIDARLTRNAQGYAGTLTVSLPGGSPP